MNLTKEAEIMIDFLLGSMVVFFTLYSCYDFEDRAFYAFTRIFEAIILGIQIALVITLLGCLAWLLVSTSNCDDFLTEGVAVVQQCLKGDL